MVPSTMPAAIMLIELGARATMVVVIALAAHVDAKSLGAGNGRCCDRESGQRRQDVT
jgi:hypothetical protein